MTSSRARFRNFTSGPKLPPIASQVLSRECGYIPGRLNESTDFADYTDSKTIEGDFNAVRFLDALSFRICEICEICGFSWEPAPRHALLRAPCRDSQSFATEAGETGEKNQALKSNIIRLGEHGLRRLALRGLEYFQTTNHRLPLNRLANDHLSPLSS